jgi:hypothetical protein
VPDNPSSIIDLSKARDKEPEKGESSNNDADEGPFCPFSWMLGHGQNKVTNQLIPMPFANACLKERCAVWDAEGEQCGVLSLAVATRSAFPGTQPAQGPAPADAE